MTRKKEKRKKKRGPKPLRFSGTFLYNGGAMNPTGGIRRAAKKIYKSLDEQTNKPSYSALTAAQWNLHPGTYGEYWNFWSSQNPNFFTDFVSAGIAQTMLLQEHPEFDTLRAIAEEKMRQDIYHSITLPGGAGQECPGYQLHSLTKWQAAAPYCKKYLGFDLTAWPRYGAGWKFLARTSTPLGPDRRVMLPAGDTHPGRGANPVEMAANAGYPVDISQLNTEELPGYGVIFHHQPQTDQETYFAFKAGPNRGHYHGDQLSFHYCAFATPLAVDHRSSYKPRAGQEHMHNRLSFATETMPYANMDGYERLIAFKSEEQASVAIGEVHSQRLRKVEALPPEKWDWDVEQEHFTTPLHYRRSVVHVTADGNDFFVLRDQYQGPEMDVAFNLHVLGDEVSIDHNQFDFPGLRLVVAGNPKFNLKRHDHVHHNGGEEKTVGLRLMMTDQSSVDLITVLLARPVVERTLVEPVSLTATYDDQSSLPKVSNIPGGVLVDDISIIFEPGFNGGVTVKKADKTTLLQLPSTDRDQTRTQGDIGLFIPDAGYPFGNIPDWLIRQRMVRPDWSINHWPLGHR